MKEPQELNRLSRLTAILTFLQTKTMVTSTQLSKRFDVSVRTIYRDIKSLMDSGVPIYVEEGKGYKLVDGYNLPPVMFTDEEAHALITAEKIIAKNKDESLVNAHHSAVEKIKAVLKFKDKNAVDQLSERITNLTNLKKETTSHNLLDIQSAITKRQCIKIAYKASSIEVPTIRFIEPMAIYHTRDNWVVIAWCRLRKAFREFRLDRIVDFDLTIEIYKERTFDLYKYFMEIRNTNY